MSIIAVAVKHLIAAGVSGDDLVRAIAEMEAEMAPPDTRSAGARRQQRYRDRIAERNEASQSVTRDASVTPPLPLDKKTQTQKINPHPEGVCIAPARKADPFPMPAGVDPQHWADFLQNRKRKRLPNTATAHEKLIRDLARWSDDEWPPGRILEHAAARGWAGIYDPRQDQDHRNGKPPQRQNGYGSGEYRDPILGDIFGDLASRLDQPGSA